ncbi:hypothetical protein CCH79_00021063, partial [Gambusia affinis]
MKALRVGLTLEQLVACLLSHEATQQVSCSHGNALGQAVDSSLSEAGRLQAAAAGSYLRDVLFSNVFSSDMRRARQ